MSCSQQCQWHFISFFFFFASQWHFIPSMIYFPHKMKIGKFISTVFNFIFVATKVFCFFLFFSTVFCFFNGHSVRLHKNVPSCPHPPRISENPVLENFKFFYIWPPITFKKSSIYFKNYIHLFTCGPPKIFFLYSGPPKKNS